MNAFVGGILQNKPFMSQTSLFVVLSRKLVHAHNILLYSLNRFLCSCRYTLADVLCTYFYWVNFSNFEHKTGTNARNFVTASIKASGKAID